MAYFLRIGPAFINLERVLIAKRIENVMELEFEGSRGQSSVYRFEGNDADLIEAGIIEYQSIVEK